MAKLFTGVAFVTFENESDARNMVHIYRKGRISRYLLKLRMCFECCGIPADALVVKDKVIQIERAPEPTDIFWENMGVSTCKRRWRFA